MLPDAAADDAITVRVGVPVYARPQLETAGYTELLQSLGNPDDPARPEFLIAPGTAADLVYWAERGYVDAVIVPPGVYAEISARTSTNDENRFTAIAELTAPPPNADLEMRGGSSVCVVRGSSAVRSIADLRFRADELTVHLVDPLSATGAIAAQAALIHSGLTLAPERVVYARSHRAALGALLVERDGDGTAVACVAREAVNQLPRTDLVRAIAIPELDTQPLPSGILMVRHGFADRSKLQTLIGVSSHFTAWSSAKEALAARWNDILRRGARQQSWRELSLEQVAQNLVWYRKTHDTPPRLAVVFSGGGAKCSYQVGVIRAVEKKLAELRESYSDPSFDISLVVGTSGGALNALPTALGISRTDEGWEDIASVWKALDQRDIIRPSPIVRFYMVLWFACVQGVILIRIRRHRHFKNPEKFPWIISKLVLIIGIFEIALARLPYKPWTLLGENGTIHHIWLWLTWGLEGSGWMLIGLGATSLILRRFRVISEMPFILRFRVARRVFWAGLIGLPLLQAWTILFLQENLSDAAGIERALATNFRSLIDRHLARLSEPPLAPPATPDEPAAPPALKPFSREVVDRKLMARDLVITGSALPGSSLELTGDLYFFLPKGSRLDERPYGSRGIALAAHRDLLFDVVIGSGAIYPVFPARTLHDFPTAGERLEIVDGSFDHRSPVEAAVLWGATHVILIQAVTDEISPRGNFVANVNAALNHLYDQAQLLDVRSKEQVVTFTVTPRPPHIGLLDFSDNLIAGSIEKGFIEGGGRPRVRPGAYRKELAEPVFATVAAR